MILNISNIPSAGETQAIRNVQAPPPAAPGQAVSSPDRVEISNQAQALARATREASARIARQAEVRDEIEQGTYDNDHRIDATVERLLDILA